MFDRTAAHRSPSNAHRSLPKARPQATTALLSKWLAGLA